MDYSSLFKIKFSWKIGPLYSLLFVLSLLYESLVLLRLWLYRIGVLRSKKADVPVISVGNLTVGGTGKTPVVDFLVKELELLNKSCAILSRGHKNQSQSSLQRVLMSETIPMDPKFLGDEPYLLASRNPTVPVYVGSDRFVSAYLAKLWDKPEFLVLDDGYQHIKLHRDLNLLLIDAERGLGNGHVLPLGELREPEHHWNRADAIILTKSNLGFSDRIVHRLRTHLKITCPLFKFSYKSLYLRRLDQKKKISLTGLKDKRIFLTCGVARPNGVLKVINQNKGDVIETSIFKDHYAYSQKTVNSLLKQKNYIEPDFWITTEKDAVKFRCYPELAMEMWFLEMEVIPDPAWQEFFINFLKQGNIL